MIFSWRGWVFIFLTIGCALSPFFVFSGSNTINNEILATMISEEAINNCDDKVLNVNFTRLDIPNNPPTRAELSSLVSQAHLDTTYHFVETEYNALVMFNENIGDYYRVPSLPNPESSILLSNVFSNHKNPNGETIFDIFEIKLLFSASNTDFRGYDNFCYIRQDDADYLIKQSNGLYHSYEDLLNETLTVHSFPNNDAYSWKIANIIAKDNDTYRHFDTVYGPWLLAYIYVPNYVGYSYSFDYAGSINTNKVYLQRHQEAFGSGNYSFSITNHNLINEDASLTNEITTMMLEGSTGYDVGVSAVFILAPLLVTILIDLFLKIHKLYGYVPFVLAAALMFFVYEGFSISYLINPLNVLYFSSNAILFFVVIAVIYFLFLFFSTISFTSRKENP